MQTRLFLFVLRLPYQTGLAYSNGEPQTRNDDMTTAERVAKLAAAEPDKNKGFAGMPAIEKAQLSVALVEHNRRNPPVYIRSYVTKVDGEGNATEFSVVRIQNPPA
jgi:hypothetical protein